MQNMNSKEAQNNFGSLMNSIVKEPVIIHKYGKPSAVVMSHEEYNKFLMFEDLYWSLKAKEAAKSGFLSVKESKDFLNSILEN